MPEPQKDDYLRNRWTGGSVRSIFQKVQRIHDIDFLYASFMLLLHYWLCLLYTDYDSIKKQCYLVLCFSLSFIILQRGCVTLQLCFYVYFML